ncbi:MAG: copper amine oxidase N-terminal domain-containing protein [Syntrophomonadaceae bacterium]|nr:copper amine oxidase N-terminal domain-containing protein [Syntrophomonadaceae bacterium]
MSSKEVAIWVYNNTAAPALDTRMLVYFGDPTDPTATATKGVKVSSSAPAGEAKVKILNVNGLFPPGEVTIGTVVGSGAAQVSVLDTKTITEGGTTAIEFTVQEGTIGGVKTGTTKALTFKLPKGFEWSGASIQNLTNSANVGGLTFSYSNDNRTLELNRGSDSFPRSLFKITANVKVDETTASYGDVNVTVTGKNTVTPNSVLIGTFSDYGYEVVVEKEAVILSGRTGDDAAIEFTIKENVKGSLLNGRTVYMTLPDGVEWTTDTTPALTDFTPSTKDGTLNLTDYNIVKNKPNVVKATISNSDASKGKVKIEANIKVAANYTGDIDVEFSGSAGIDETVTVAEAIAPLTGKVDVVDVIIGSQDQKSADIVITENEAEALMSTVAAGDKAELYITLPAGASWAKLPAVTVDNGLDIGTPTRKENNNTSNNRLVIPIRAQSDEAANITISDVYLTLDRTVPEGDLKVSVGGAAIDSAKIDNRTTALSLVIAEVVTPAPGETVGSCEFKIGSNIYYAGGVAKVMDVAPYIKGDRTYVPMRYMGETLGAEVVWDEAARKVTLNKDEITVEFTIGSTTYTVNGEAKTADVAPEITNDRTMLPARFVAEAFGAVVGWDAGSQTVLIQK